MHFFSFGFIKLVSTTRCLDKRLQQRRRYLNLIAWDLRNVLFYVVSRSGIYFQAMMISEKLMMITLAKDWKLTPITRSLSANTPGEISKSYIHGTSSSSLTNPRPYTHTRSPARHLTTLPPPLHHPGQRPRICIAMHLAVESTTFVSSLPFSLSLSLSLLGDTCVHTHRLSLLEGQSTARAIIHCHRVPSAALALRPYPTSPGLGFHAPVCVFVCRSLMRNVIEFIQ